MAMDWAFYGRMSNEELVNELENECTVYGRDRHTKWSAKQMEDNIKTMKELILQRIEAKNG